MNQKACSCGCGILINSFDKKGRERFYVFSHQNINRLQSLESKEKNKIAHIGKKTSEETKKKMSKSHKQLLILNSKIKEKLINNLKSGLGKTKGIPLSESHKKKISNSHKGKMPKNIGLLLEKGKQFYFQKGLKHTQESLEKQKQTKIKNGTYKKPCSEKHKLKLSNLMKERIKIIRKNMKVRLNKPESSLYNLIKDNSIALDFVGDGTFWVNNKNPDFINREQKLIVEVFGDYWHNPLKNQTLKNHQTVCGTIEHYEKFGYKCLILWEREVKDYKNNFVIERLSDFINQRGVLR